jgi:hypothetical protein
MGIGLGRAQGQLLLCAAVSHYHRLLLFLEALPDSVLVPRDLTRRRLRVTSLLVGSGPAAESAKLPGPHQNCVLVLARVAVSAGVFADLDHRRSDVRAYVPWHEATARPPPDEV